MRPAARANMLYVRGRKPDNWHMRAALFKYDNIEIEYMTEDDLPEVMEIEQEAFSDPWTSDMFYSEIFNSFSRLWVIREVSGKLIGYICFWRVVDEAHILNLAVHKQYRRQGHALKFLIGAIDFWKKDRVKTVLLEVRKSNRAALELYDKLGFQVLISRTRYYKNPVEDAWVMALEI